MRVSNLGLVHWERFERTGDRADLEHAIDAHREALELTPETSHHRPRYLRALGDALRSRYAQTKVPADRRAAIEAFRDSSGQGLEANVDAALSAARTWGDWALRRESWDEAVEAYGLGVDAADRLVRRQLLRGHKETSLRNAQGLAAPAALAIARSGDVERAAVTLERGRALLMSEALDRNRADLEALGAGQHGELAGRYRTAAEQLSILERTEQDARQASAWAVEHRTELETSPPA